MKLVNKISYPLDVLTLVELTANAKTEFLYIKSDVSKLIESYGIEVFIMGISLVSTSITPNNIIYVSF